MLDRETKVVIPSVTGEGYHIPQQVIDCLKDGGTAIIPTETVYGLSANGLSSKAVTSIFTAKGRPSDNPLILHISSLDMWETLVEEIPDKALKLAKHFWPGPLTIILKKSPLVPMETSGGLDTVAVRMPSHPVALSVIKSCGLPLAAPSANISGKPSPTRLDHCTKDMMGRVDYIIDGGSCDFGVESTVINMVGDTPIILRPGAITGEEISQLLGCQVMVDNAVTAPLSQDTAPSSPGMKYTHYSPKAQVILVDGSLASFIDYVKDNNATGVYALVFDGEEELMDCPTASYGSAVDSLSQAKLLFDALRSLDRDEVNTIYVRCPSKEGVGLAVYNRLIRAAGFKTIDLNN